MRLQRRRQTGKPRLRALMIAPAACKPARAPRRPKKQYAMFRLYGRFRRKRISKLYDLYNIQLFVTNPLPPLFFACGSVLALIFAWRYSHYIGDFLFWFVDLLQLAKVLKIGFITQKHYYDYVSHAVYAYVALAFLLDVRRFLAENLLRDVFFKNGRFYVHRFGFLNHRLLVLDVKRQNVTVELRTGFLRRMLGLERVRLTVPGQDDVLSPFLVSMKKNNMADILRL